MKNIGVISRGIKLPIIRTGDDLEHIIINSILRASTEGRFILSDGDVVCITESLVARAQGNYCTVDDIANDIKHKIGENKQICVMYPILSRNRFSLILKGIARAAKEVVLILSYPSDEVGNALLTYDQLDDLNIDPNQRVLDLKDYRRLFGNQVHEFTGVDYVQYYKDLVEAENAKCTIFFSNQTGYFGSMGYDAYIAADIHTRKRTKKLLKKSGADLVLGLDDILTSSVDGSGYNPDYGVLGSNKAGEEKLKLFPRDAQELVDNLHKFYYENLHVDVQVMVYGDGAFKDPQGKIWELADPVVSPFYTDGLVGTPNEIKIKYFAADKFASLNGVELEEHIIAEIASKDANLVGKMVSEGTTPRQYTDLLGSLADLTSGSGDRGTPVVLIQNYFKNYTN